MLTAAQLPRQAGLTPNPTVLREIGQDSRDLSRLLTAARRVLLDSHKPVWMHACKPLAMLLVRLRDQLAMHFALEEACGGADDPLRVEPRLADEAVHLRNQHQQIYHECAEVADMAATARYGASPLQIELLAERFARFDRHFRAHEADEKDLLMRATNEDIGTGD